MIINVESAIQTLTDIRNTAIKVGIYEHVTLGYGTLLGMIRENGFIKHDDDLDVIILTDRITPEQELAYFNGLNELGLFRKRHRIKRRLDTGRLLWTSMKRTEKDTKCCSWYYQNIDKWYFHGKGHDWVEKIGLRLRPKVDQTYESVLKGIQASFFDHMIEREFMGLKFYIPLAYGKLLDYWYPNFSIPQKGIASWEDILLIVPSWKQPKSWKFMRRSHDMRP